MKRFAAAVAALLIGSSVAVSPIGAGPAQAADPTLTITPITWNVIGLDSNAPATGPNRFPVGARVCASGADAAATTATFTWDSDNAYISLRPSPVPGPDATLSLGDITAGTCADAYFEVQVQKVAAAWLAKRSYHITATSGSVSVSTPTPRELYVEKLISQNRNGITAVKLDGVSIPAGGTMSLVEGAEYDITLDGYTATQGYNQLESFITLPTTVFRILSVTTTYSAQSSPYVGVAPLGKTADRLYADACKWDPDPGSPTYRSCIGGDYKSGGTVSTTYHVRIIDGSAGASETLTSLLYDFSGSSFHYNADAGAGFRVAVVVGSDQVTLAKSFSPKAVAPGDSSQLTFKIANPTGKTFTGVHFTDTLPTNLVVAASPSVTYEGCGSGAFSPEPTGGDTTLTFTGATVAAGATCTITVMVKSDTADTYTNTTGHLFIDELIDTGNVGTDTLLVKGVSACVAGQTLANWTVPVGATNPPDAAGGVPTVKSANVATASATVNPALTGVNGSAIVTAGQNDNAAWNTWGYGGAGQYVEFTLDTSNFSDVSISFWVKNPSPANGATSTVLSTNPGSGLANVKTWTTPTTTDTYTELTFTPLAGAVNTSGDTTFRITSTGAKNNNSGASLVFDNILFTGCGPAAPAPTLTKAFSANSIHLDATATLTFTIANTAEGAAAQTGLAFVDVLPDGLTVADGGPTTACGGSVTTTAATGTIAFTGGTLGTTEPANTCSFDVTVTGAVANAYTNTTGFLSSNESGTTSSYGTDTLEVVAPPVLVKEWLPASTLPSVPVTLRFTITNPNPATTLTGIHFSDALPLFMSPAISAGGHAGCGGFFNLLSGLVILFNGTLAPGASCTFDLPFYGLGASPLTVPNETSPISSSQSADGPAASATLTVAQPIAAIETNKEITTTPNDPTSWRKAIGVTAGTDVYYRFTLYNSGDLPLTSLWVSDLWLLGVSPLSGCDWPATLSPGESASCTYGPYTVGTTGVENTAQGGGVYSGTAYDSTSKASFDILGLTLDKTAQETTFDAAGDVLHYDYTVENTGGFPLEGPVTVADDKSSDEACDAVSTATAGGVLGDGDNWLDPGEAVTCSATYTVASGDVTLGSVTNTATATVDGVDSNEDQATVTYSAPQVGVLTIDKVADATTITEAGQVVTYTITLGNTGNAGLTGVTLADPGCGSKTGPTGDNANFGSLDPGEHWVYTCQHVITQAEMDAGDDIVNTATAGSDQTGDVTDSVSIGVDQAPSLTIDKTADTSPVTSVGSLGYTIVVTNTGNVSLTAVSVTDPACDAAPALQSGDLANADVLDVGEVWTYTCVRTVTQAEIDAGTALENTASVDTGQTTPQTDSASVPVTQNAAIVVDKQSTTEAITAVGQVVPFTITVTNSGNVTLTGVTLADPGCDAAPVYQSGDTGSDEHLSPGEGWTYTCSHTVTQAEMDAGGVLSNVATADSDQTGPVDGSKDVVITQSPSTTITKTADRESLTEAGPINYTIKVTNNGNVSLTGVDVVDAFGTAVTLVSGDDTNPGVLDVGETWVYTTTYNVIQPYFDQGKAIVNTATVDTDQTEPESATVSTPLELSPDLTISKTSTTAEVVNAGQIVPYLITVTNTGNVSLASVQVDDTRCDAAPSYATGDTGGDSLMGPGEAWVYTCSRTVTQAEMDAGGSLTNTASADTDRVGPVEDALSIPIAQHPALSIVKTITSGGTFGKVGDVITYAYQVTNTGNVTIGGPITVVDDKTDVTCPAVDALAPAEDLTCTSTYAVTAEDIAAGSVTNTAKASGQFGEEVVASAVMDATASYAPIPTEPPSSSSSIVPAEAGAGLLALLALLGVGLLAFAVAARPKRRRTR